MNLILVSQAENDLESIRDPEKVRRIAKKIDNIENKIKQGVGPEKIIEKRLSGNWSPMLQQRVGDYRLWFVQGKDTGKGENEKLYLLRVLEKENQQKLKGIDINPDNYL